MTETITQTVTVATLPVLAYQGTRVVTTGLLAQLYGTDSHNITVNYRNNEERFEAGKHFIKLTGDELRAFKHQVNEIDLVKIARNASHLLLWTERGAARHAKMLDTDQAWEVFEKLEDNYFRVGEQHKAPAPVGEENPFKLSGEARTFAIQYLDQCQKAAQAGKAPPPLDESQMQQFADGLMSYMLLTKRWLVSFGWNDKINLQPVPSNCYVIPPEQFASVISDGGSPFPRKLLPKIAEACIERLAR